MVAPEKPLSIFLSAPPAEGRGSWILINSEPKMPELVDLYAMVSRMRVLGMSRTTECTDLVMRSIVEACYTPNRTLADLRELTKTGHGIDPLKDFSTAAREELHAFALL